MKRTIHAALLALFIAPAVCGASEYVLESPSGRLHAGISAGDSLTVSMSDSAGNVLLSPSTIGLSWTDGTEWGRGSKVGKTTKSEKCDTLEARFYKKTRVADCYRGLTLKMKDGFDVEFRLYDDGLAYRFVNCKGKRGEVRSETAVYRFPGDADMWLPYVRNRKKKLDAPSEELFWNDMQNQYTHTSLSGIVPGRLIFTPCVADTGNGLVAFAEADVEAWPGMYLTLSSEPNALEGVSAGHPSRTVAGGHNDVEYLVEARYDYIARVDGRRTMPWRTFIYAPEASRLPENDMVWRLASASRLADTSWIRPGKVAWEWWNDCGVYGVDFEAGINTPTYMKYIDFAADYGIEYVIMDEGWATKGANDLFSIVPEIDMDAILGHAAEKGVGIILWAGFRPMTDRLEEVAAHYAEKGVKGFKIDFLNRDDQEMAEEMYRIAEVCGRHGLLVDFHGCCKPSGLQRTWPNVLSYEAVFGLEQLKWSKPGLDQISYDVTLPFIRGIAGPTDYTPGAMRNAPASQYYPCRSNPMSQGTRCRQIAEFLVFDSPLAMMSDSPTNYEREKECAEFIASLPTTFAETRVLSGEIGSHIATLRKGHDGNYYIGSMTGTEALELELPLDFLPEGGFVIEEFSDGANATRQACDYRRRVREVSRDSTVRVSMVPGGGYAARISKK